jgi:hypothetical protein
MLTTRLMGESGGPNAGTTGTGWAADGRMPSGSGPIGVAVGSGNQHCSVPTGLGRLNACQEVEAEMSRTKVNPTEVGRLALGFVTFSLVCAALVVMFPGIGWVRAFAGSLGFNATKDL